jgi:hypothetical protein
MMKKLFALIDDAQTKPEVLFRAVDSVLRIMVRPAQFLGLDGRPSQPEPTPSQVARQALMPMIAGATEAQLRELRAFFAQIGQQRAEKAGVNHLSE